MPDCVRANDSKLFLCKLCVINKVVDDISETCPNKKKFSPKSERYRLNSAIISKLILCC